MGLEATVLVLDNSEFMRNGDYTPSRLEAQADAATLLFNAKTQSNPENTVSLMTMAGKSPSVLVTLTSDFGKIISALSKVAITGSANVSTGVQIAQLVLKHRQNKNQRQRIIVFVASPILEDEAALVKLGKKLKKNNISVDIINFGEEATNTSKCQAFIEAVNSSDNSHLVSIPPGPHLLSDVLITSPIVSEDGVAPVGMSSGGYEFGVDPSLDPELALALRISMEEEKARQDKQQESSSEGKTKEMTVEEQLLAEAMAMSLESNASVEDMDVDAELTEEEQVKRAIEMSMNMPGVDMTDERVKNVTKGEGKEKK